MNFRALLILFFFAFSVSLSAQESGNVSQRTPEQEAARQTERLKQELNLSPEQVREVYNINLYYAIQRQTSNSRAEAMERIRNKDADLKRVLNAEQYNQLQNKHYERSTHRISSEDNRPVRRTEGNSQNTTTNRNASQPRRDATTRSSETRQQPSENPTNRQPATQPTQRQNMQQPPQRQNMQQQQPSRSPQQATPPASRQPQSGGRR
jgi:hypothetical protein